jgi:phosphotransferase system IIB component
MLSSLAKKGVNAALSFGNISKITHTHTHITVTKSHELGANNKALKQPRGPDGVTRLWNFYFCIHIHTNSISVSANGCSKSADLHNISHNVETAQV